MSDDALKAYEVYDGDDGWKIVFAKSNVVARREGANELNICFEDVDHCKRMPSLDQYAPGPVPPLAMIEAGWWFECCECSKKISKDGFEDEELDEDGNEPVFAPVERGQFIFCCQTCASINYATKRRRHAAIIAMTECTHLKFPGSQVVHVNDCDEIVTEKHQATFTYPGAAYQANWKFGGDDVRVFKCDIEIFKRLYGVPDESPACQQ